MGRGPLISLRLPTSNWPAFFGPDIHHFFTSPASCLCFAGLDCKRSFCGCNSYYIPPSSIVCYLTDTGKSLNLHFYYGKDKTVKSRSFSIFIHICVCFLYLPSIKTQKNSVFGERNINAINGLPKRYVRRRMAHYRVSAHIRFQLPSRPISALGN